MGMNTDPWPFIWSCYLIGALAVFGSLLWVSLHQRKLDSLMNVLEKEK